MGAYLSEPMTAKETEEGEGNRIKYGACSMQGWRVSQEDAHNCVPNFDEKSSLFAVYDGHGGAEVAIYLSRHLPEFLKNCEAYKKGEFEKALEECFLKIDESIKTPEVIKEIQLIAKSSNNEGEEAAVDFDEENVGALYEEATMPLDKLVAKYQSGSGEESKVEEDSDCKPGSSKSVAGSSSARSSRSSGAGQSSSASASAVDPSASSGSASASGSSSSTADVKTNGDNNTEVPSSVGNSAGGSETVETASDVKVKTEENGCKTGESSIELIVEGKKIELKSKEEEANCEKSDSTKTEVIQPEKSVNGNSNSESKVESKETEVKANAEEGSTNCTVNGDSVSKDENSSSTVQPASATSSEAGNSNPETPRRKKVHPVPIVIENSKQERRSPRKNQQKSFECSDSDDSDEDDEDAGFDHDESDSEDLDDEECLGEEDSSDDDDDDDDEDEYGEDDDEEDERFLSDVQEPGYDSGCTAVVCYMKWEADSLSLWVANAGDSRCVVCRDGKAIDMSHDHKPESEVEAKRIVKAGGKVTEDGRVNGGLNLSRAIGDHSYKQNATLPPEEQMISPLPTVEHIVLNPSQDKFVVLACDGIWNSMSSQEVVDFVSQRIEKKVSLPKICEELFDACLAPDTCGDGTGCDNMTAIIVQLTEAGEVFSGSKRRFNSGEEKDDLINEDSTKKLRAE